MCVCVCVCCVRVCVCAIACKKENFIIIFVYCFSLTTCCKIKPWRRRQSNIYDDTTVCIYTLEYVLLTFITNLRAAKKMFRFFFCSYYLCSTLMNDFFFSLKTNVVLVSFLFLKILCFYFIFIFKYRRL